MPEPASEGETVVSHVQYNTPIGLYSNDNVMEAFEGQTGGLVTGVDGYALLHKHASILTLHNLLKKHVGMPHKTHLQIGAS